MNINELIQRQLHGYSKFHQSKLNLWIHIVVVPIFIVCFGVLLFSVITLDPQQSLFALTLMIIAIVIQGIGHKKEELPPEPFTGPLNAILRILFEQIYTFPKFVFSGGWRSAVRNK